MTQLIIRILKALLSRRKQRLLAIWLINTLVGKINGAIYYAKTTARIICQRVLPSAAYDKLFRAYMFAKSLVKKPQFSTRVYLKPGLDYERFIQKLHQSDCSYVVLRWFESWPVIEEGEDIDILIADDDLDTIRSFCVPYDNGCQKLDIYSQTGKERSSYNGASYFPEPLATQLLRTRVLYKNAVYVPQGLPYFLSLAYHCVCHKGFASGLAADSQSKAKQKSDHDYQDLMQQEANKLGLSKADITLSGLFAALEKNEALPQRDTLALFARYNDWLFNHLNKSTAIEQPAKGDVIVFVIRQWANDNQRIAEILQSISDEKLYVIDHVILNAEQITNATQAIRGGQWDAGPYPQSGGEPHSFVICFDYAPITPRKKTTETYPFISNERVLLKHRIRDDINRQLLLWRRVNCIHSSDNEEEARDYIAILDTNKQATIAQKIAAIRDSSYFSDWPIQEVYVENGTRAKTCLIDYNGKPAILKLFKPEAKRFFEREIFVYQQYGAELKQLPQILEIGDNYFIAAFYENQLKGKSVTACQTIVREHSYGILAFLKFFYDKGYAVLGFYPGNLIITPDKKLIIIDFEFLHHYEMKPASFAQSYDLVGVPKDFNGDMPRGDSNHTLKNTWKGYLDDKIVSEFLSQE